MNDERGTMNRNRIGRDLRERTTDYALRIVRLFGALPKDKVAQVIGAQVLRSGTSVGAHYREATRARSDAEFVSKLEAGLQEIEETSYWLGLQVKADVIAQRRLAELQAETEELAAIFVSSVKTVKRRRKGK